MEFRYWLDGSSSNENEDLSSSTTPSTTTIENESSSSGSKVQQLIQHMRRNKPTQQPQSSKRQEFYNNQSDFIPLESEEDMNTDEEQSFYVVDNVPNSPQPAQLTCPSTLKEMMIIVQEVRQQRADFLNHFKYTTPGLTESESQTPALQNKLRSNNYEDY